MTGKKDGSGPLENVLFRTPESPSERRARQVSLILVYLLGVGFWVFFFGRGNLSLVVYDWVKEAAYLNTLRDALVTGGVPWEWSEIFYHRTTYFLANPEFALTPDVLLLPWLANGSFVLLHVLLFYSVGFLASLRLAAELGASLVATVFFWLVFNFNGYLTAHLAVGHFQWTGYFLLPLFFLLFSHLVEGSRAERSTLAGAAPAMGVLLGVLLLNGSVHIAAWLCMFLGLSLVWSWSHLQGVVVSILIGILLGFGRLLPAVLYFPPKRGFVSGYPDLGTLLEGLTTLRGYDSARLGSGLGRRAGWWEYDAYIGVTALLVVVICCILARRRKGDPDPWPLVGTAGLFLILSLGNVYTVLGSLPGPLGSLERVSSRLVAVPLTVSLIVATRGLDEAIRRWPRRGKAASLLLLPLVATELWHHARLWRLPRLERGFGDVVPPELSSVPPSDPTYGLVVTGSWLLSVITVVVLAIWWTRDGNGSA